MNRQEKLDRINELTREVKSLKAELNKPKPPVLVNHKDLVQYMINSSWVWDIFRPEVEVLTKLNDVGRSKVQKGEVFQSKYQAQRFARKWAIRQKFDRLAEMANGGVCDHKQGVNVWHIVVRARDGSFEIAKGSVFNRGCNYFKNEANAQLCLDALTDEDCLSLWGIRKESK